jgi:hypothetical protein
MQTLHFAHESTVACANGVFAGVAGVLSKIFTDFGPFACLQVTALEPLLSGFFLLPVIQASAAA